MMFKMNQLAVGLFLFLSSLFSCQQKGDFKSMNVDDFDNLIQNEDIQRLDVRKGIRSLNLIRDSILGRRQARRLSISRCGEKYRF